MDKTKEITEGNNMENLTKENFWNQMYEKYPESTKHFCDWIDEYKKKNNWGKLFNNQYRQDNIKRASNGEICSIDFSAPKYHDLPLAIQMGIWREYLDTLNIGDCKSDIEGFLSAQQEGMDELKSK